jgi:hypothetical protein
MSDEFKRKLLLKLKNEPITVKELLSPKCWNNEKTPRTPRTSGYTFGRTPRLSTHSFSIYDEKNLQKIKDIFLSKYNSNSDIIINISGDTKIKRKDFEAFLIENMIDISRFNEYFNQIDANKDGLITLSDLHKFLDNKI